MAATAKKKGKKGLLIGVILLIVFVAAGAIAGLAMAGKINIPGITPKKKPPATPAKPKVKPKKIIPPKKEVVAETAPTVKILDKVGAAKLAKVWDEMTADKLVKVVDKWEPKKLAFVMNEMDATKVAELLAVMEPKTASTVSQELQTIASQVPIEEN